ncbi:MAG: DUF6364 family protein [Cytophagales bacterium]|jgi:hypothetical protein|nr:DUF6364 family protein [Cytophagales bacterium]
MNTKLTLTIEQSVIEEAKKYAKDKGKSLSGLVENYLKAIVSEPKVGQPTETPIVQSLKGSFSAPESFDYQKELAKALAKKYM